MPALARIIILPSPGTGEVAVEPQARAKRQAGEGLCSGTTADVVRIQAPHPPLRGTFSPWEKEVVLALRPRLALHGA